MEKTISVLTFEKCGLQVLMNIKIMACYYVKLVINDGGRDDATVMQMGAKLRTGDELYVYVDHTNRPTSGGEEPNQHFVQVAGSSQDSSDFCQSTKNGKNGDDDQPHLTFNEFLLPVNLLTDDEDDKLQEAKDRVRSFWTRNKTKMVSDDIGDRAQTQEENEEVDDEDE
ncbi:conserved hypothetical protein [Ricinus communis]|uniref:Uncharacterized protein n=1 Tax=Ricinus communis TaxID=3988 RepID=B9RQG3_RICCO|nr:conserved hypothetical protein [Ricinus communis]